MRKTHHLFTILALISLLSAHAPAQSGDSAQTDSAHDRPAYVPSVPLPTAVFGSLASVGVMFALWNSKHRRWLTLR